MQKRPTWRDLVKKGQIEDAIVEFARIRRGAMFFDIQQNFSSYVNAYGDRSMEKPGNVVLWAGLGDELADLLSRLLEEERLFLHPANLYSYLWDGVCLNLPLAKRIPKNGYKTPHWLPCCLKTVPFERR